MLSKVIAVTSTVTACPKDLKLFITISIFQENLIIQITT
jgi:hypothetical protein